MIITCWILWHLEGITIKCWCFIHLCRCCEIFLIKVCSLDVVLKMWMFKMNCYKWKLLRTSAVVLSAIHWMIKLGVPVTIYEEARRWGSSNVLALSVFHLRDVPVNLDILLGDMFPRGVTEISWCPRQRIKFLSRPSKVAYWYPALTGLC